VRPHRGGRGEARLHPLGEKRRHDPGQDVTRAGRRQRRRAAGDERSLSRRADECPLALEDHDAPEAVHGTAQRFEPVRIDPRRLLVEQPTQLTRMRREDRRGFALERPELTETVGVDHGRQIGVLQQPVDQIVPLRA
jgi:hypothetical protein